MAVLIFQGATGVGGFDPSVEQEDDGAHGQASATAEQDVVFEEALGEGGFPAGLDFQVEEGELGEEEDFVGEAWDGGEGGVEGFGDDGGCDVELGSQGGEPVQAALLQEHPRHRVLLAGHASPPELEND
jgi:hypothetical protein